MPTFTRPPSRDLTLTRRLSIEETYHLADHARRKSSSEVTRNDLRMRIGHSNVLGQLLLDIAQTEKSSAKTSAASANSTSADAKTKHPHILWAPQEVSKTSRYELDDEYDDGEEDLEELSLVRAPTRRPQR